MAEHPEKKLVNIPVACTPAVKEKIARFAEAANLSSSAFVFDLIIEFLDKKDVEAMLLNDIFGYEILNK
jgi:hypothetical protein